MKFRIPEKHEYPEILELVARVLAPHELTINPAETDSDLSDIEGYYLQNNGHFEVLELNNKIAGSYGIYPLSDESCELRKMYVDTTLQGQGLGKKIMERALEKARELGYREMVLETNSRLDKALQLYIKYGFRECESDHLADRADLAMKRSLSGDME